MWDWDLFWTWLGRVADASSLVAAVASGYAAVKIGRIGARLAFNVKAEGVLRRVHEHAQWIQASLSRGSFDANQLMSRIVQCEAEIESIRKGVSGEASVAVRQLKAFRKAYVSAVKNKAESHELNDLLWGMFNAITIFHIHATSVLGNRKMGVSDAAV